MIEILFYWVKRKDSFSVMLRVRVILVIFLDKQRVYI
jgi:hypothetical protein